MSLKTEQQEMARSRQRHRGMESELNMSKLRNECCGLKAKVGALEAAVREISSDPNKNLPVHVDRRRRLPKMQLKLRRCVGSAHLFVADRDNVRWSHFLLSLVVILFLWCAHKEATCHCPPFPNSRLKSKHENLTQLLENLEEQGSMNEAMRRAAAIGDEISVKRLLSRGVDVNVVDESGYCAFMYCCGQGHLGVAELMIAAGGADVHGSDNAAPLAMATGGGHVEVVRLLLRHGAAVDRRDELHRTPLLIACEGDRVGCARALLAAGANPNATDRRRNTGLHHAAVSGSDLVAGMLVEYGVDGSLKNDDHMTALAIARSRRHFKVVDAITKRG